MVNLQEKLNGCGFQHIPLSELTAFFTAINKKITGITTQLKTYDQL